MRTYELQPHIKWLGLVFDSNLSFRQHVHHLASQGATSWVAANSCKHNGQAEPSEDEDPVQCLHLTSTILCFTSVVEQ